MYLGRGELQFVGVVITRSEDAPQDVLELGLVTDQA